jgi:four helix bundle protein
MEVQTQLEISKQLGFGETEALNRSEGLSHEIGKMLVAIMNNL